MIFNRQMKSFAIGATAAVITGIGILSAPVQAAILSGRVQLSDLIGTGNSYQLGDKLFDNFRSFIRLATGGAVAPTAAEISVTGVVNNGSFDLLFESDRWNVTAGQVIDTGFRYDVTVLDPQQAITSAGVALTDYDVTGNGRIVVTDTITLLDPGVGNENILIRSIAGRDSGQVALTPPQTRISVAKDIALSGLTGSATLRTVTQSVRQRVPESGNLLGLFVVGGIGLTVMAKKLKLKTTVLN